MYDGVMTKCDCGRQWTGLTECHCTGCHRHFTSVQPFDAHWIGVENRHCVDPAALKRKDGSPLLDTVERKSGSVWRMYRPDLASNTGALSGDGLRAA